MKKETKTKAELLKEIEENEKNIQDLHAQINGLERYKKYEEAANEIKALHDAFTQAGFTDEQAFTLLNNILANSIGNNNGMTVNYACDFVGTQTLQK